MLHLEQAVVVEGKYDKIKLNSIIDGVIITTNGFSVLKNKEKLELIRYYAKNKGIIILTDSDSAGFKIRNFIKGAVKDGKITNVYIPDVFGKEKRKTAPSKEGKLGVEGIDKNVLLEAFEKAGVTSSETTDAREKITKLDLYNTGFSGNENSSEKRKALLKSLNMPELLTSNSMLEILNTMMSREEFYALAENLPTKGE
jgi:ribonuclease M5